MRKLYTGEMKMEAQITELRGQQTQPNKDGWLADKQYEGGRIKPWQDKLPNKQNKCLR